MTDEELRTAFLAAPEATLRDLCAQGLNLSGVEVAALVATDHECWRHAARLIDARLQKASLSRRDQPEENDCHE
jgi:hypothetical protein